MSSGNARVALLRARRRLRAELSWSLPVSELRDRLNDWRTRGRGAAPTTFSRPMRPTRLDGDVPERRSRSREHRRRRSVRHRRARPPRRGDSARSSRQPASVALLVSACSPLPPCSARRRGLARRRGAPARRRDLTQGSARGGRRAGADRSAFDARDRQARDATRRRPEDRRSGEPAAAGRRPFCRPSQLSTEPLADGYAKVTITGGELSASTHRAAMSPLLQKRSPLGQPTTTKVDLASVRGEPDLPTFVVAVARTATGT